MDSLVVTLGLAGLKPLLTALALPPVPLLLLLLLSGRLLLSEQRRLSGALLLLANLLLLWLMCCAGVGTAIERLMLRPPPALSEARINTMRQETASYRPVVLVLGGGRDALAPEYGEAHLSARSMQRLHYGLWLARRLNAPVMFSGGVGLSQAAGAPEADIAARIAERDYGRKLRWVEATSRDTRENAAASLNLLAGQGITDIVLVTHGWHMTRAVRAFEDAKLRIKQTVQIVPAPIGLAPSAERALMNWLPTPEGFVSVRQNLREAMGLLFGA